MRYASILLIALTFGFLACKKNESSTRIPIGEYKGTFQRSINSSVSNVTLNLSLKEYEGESQYAKYPAICKGSYSIKKDSISFENECAFTADFDWSLILSGKYDYSVRGDSLIMTRKYDGVIFYKDVYKLKRQ